MTDESGVLVTPPVSARRRLGRAWLLTTLTNGSLGLIVFAVTPWAANILGPAGRGRLTAIQLVPQMLADLSSVGLTFAVVHFGSARRGSLRVLMRWSVRPAVYGTVAMFTLGQLLVWPIVGGGSDATLMRVYLLMCPLTAVMSISAESLRSFGDFGRWNGFVFLRGLSWPVALFIGVVGSPSIGRIVYTHLSLTALITLALVVVVRRRTADAGREPVTDPPTYVRYGLLSAASTIPRVANAKLDQVVMSFRVPDRDLGLYSAAVGWSAITLPVMRGFTGVAMPHVSEATAEEVPTRVRQVVTTALAATLALVVIGGLMTVLVWHLRYGDSFDGAYVAALVLIPAGLLLEYNAILANVLRSLHRPGLVAVLEVVVLVVSTLTLLAILRSSTVTGPALVSLVTYATACAVYLVAIARQLGVPVLSLFDARVLTRLAGRVRPRPQRSR